KLAIAGLAQQFQTQRPLGASALFGHVLALQLETLMIAVEGFLQRRHHHAGQARLQGPGFGALAWRRGEIPLVLGERTPSHRAHDVVDAKDAVDDAQPRNGHQFAPSQPARNARCAAVAALPVDSIGTISIRGSSPSVTVVFFSTPDRSMYATATRS